MANETQCVMVATELEPASARVVDFAAAWARLFDLPLLLVHVADALPEVDEWPGGSPIQPYLDGLRARLEARHDRVRDALEAERLRCEAAGVSSRMKLLDGVAWREIVDTAHEENAVCIVVGTHTPEPGEILSAAIHTRLFGSTAERVLRRVGRSVWVIPTDQPIELKDVFRRLLVGVDFSSSSIDALRLSRQAAERAGGTIGIVHAVDVGPWQTAGSTKEDRDAIAKLLQGNVLERLKALPGEGPTVEQAYCTPTTSGRPHQVILSEAKRLGATAIAIGAHGEHPLGAAGNNAERCARGTLLPLLIARRMAR